MSSSAVLCYAMLCYALQSSVALLHPGYHPVLDRTTLQKSQTIYIELYDTLLGYTILCDTIPDYTHYAIVYRTIDTVRYYTVS